jgi:hypothetical protein
MNWSARSLVPVIVAVVLAGSHPVSGGAQAPIDVYDLADYRLTPAVFTQFVQASQKVGEIFTKEVVLSGDAVVMATGLVARLDNHAGLTAALQAAKLTSREYSKFAITLVAAHMAHGFIKAGVLPRVPDGAPTHNVEFVDTHQTEVTAVLAKLGMRD